MADGMSTFRPEYRVLSEFEKDALRQIKAKAAELEALFAPLGVHGREGALALTKLEECVMWATKGITK
jgi:hypothetical protein